MDSFAFKGTQGAYYDKFRPKVPSELLLDHLDKVSGRNRYLDVATGTGQIIFQLAKFFKQA